MLKANETHISFALEGQSVNFQVLSFVGREALNQPFAFDIELVSEDPDLDLSQMMHKPGCLTFGSKGEGQGIVHGLVHRIEQGEPGKRLTRHSIKLVPHLAYLCHTRDQKIFQHLTVPKIIAKVLEAHGILANVYSFQLGDVYPERDYCVQYDESDLDFIQRLCEEEGIHFHFQHSASGHQLVFGDNQTIFRKLAPVAYHQDSGMAAERPVIRRFDLRLETRTTRVSRRDYDFEKPRIRPEGAAKSGSVLDLEDYSYPGRFTSPDRGKQLATRALERHRRDYQLAEGKGDEPTLATGHFLPLSGHTRTDWNDLWLLQELVHEGKQPQVLGEHSSDFSDITKSKDGFDQGYRNRFLASPWHAIYRPALDHPKGRVMGDQTAIVTGPPGEEIHCDQYGRVKVQFHWDRDSQSDHNSSCWLRVASGWAGNAYGGIAIPRVGMEVLVTYLEGDPDQPVIVGCLFNGNNRVPYALPAKKTRSTFKTLSSRGGEGYNEFRIEDKKGAEQIYVHAQRDWEENIGHDQKITVGNQRHDTVEADTFSEFKNEEHRITHLDRKTEVRGNDHLSVGGTQHVKVQTAQQVETGREIHIHAGEKVVIDAGLELTAKASGSFIKMDPGGVTLSGAKIDLNSGGAPGVGTGIQVLAPRVPGLAASDRAGQLLNPPPAGKPAPLPALAEPEQKEGLEEEEEEEEVEVQELTLHIGVFFDGTGNNRSNSERAYGCFAPDVNLADAAEDIRKFCADQGYDGKGSSPDNSYGNDVSNVARLYDLYINDADKKIAIDASTANLRIYVEGIGTSSTAPDSMFSQATGRGAQGVRARVKETPKLIFNVLEKFKDNNPNKPVKKIEFDVFGFSRGAAAARDFANEVLKGQSSILAKDMPVGTPGLVDDFAWKPNCDVAINFIGLYDTVAAIANPWVWDWDGHNNYNPGINLHLAPDVAKKVVHLVAEHERRYNFALNSAGAADIILPGVHSDLGGGYLPKAVERILLSKPRHCDVEEKTSRTEANSYHLAQDDLSRIKVQRGRSDLSLEIRTWEVRFSNDDKQARKDMKRVYAAVSSQREVRSDLSLVYLRIMRQLAVENGVPFRQINHKDPRLVLPAELATIFDKLLAYAQGKSNGLQLSAQEHALLFQRYVHISDNWNAAKNFNNSDLNVVFINRPDENAVRTVHPNE